MFFEEVDKFSNIPYIMLSIRIKCNNILPTVMKSLLSYKGKTCFECCSSSTIDDMSEKKYLPTKPIIKEHLSTITRSIIDHEDILESRDKNTLDHIHDSRGFIVRADEEEDATF